MKYTFDGHIEPACILTVIGRKHNINALTRVCFVRRNGSAAVGVMAAVRSDAYKVTAWFSVEPGKTNSKVQAAGSAHPPLARLVVAVVSHGNYNPAGAVK